MSELYLSRVTLRPSLGGPPWARLRDPHDVHQALWKAFPAVAAGTASPFLFRADRVRVDDSVQLRALVQSERAPDWTQLGATLVSADGPKHLHEWLEANVSTGAVLRFFLRANTTKAARVGGPVRDTRGKRVAIEGEQQQREWLLKRLEALGARVCERESVVRDGRGQIVQRTNEAELRTSNTRVWQWGSAKSERHGVHQGVDFEGLIEVLDASKLRAAVENGIGPAKGLGFGMLSLATVG